MRLRQEPIEGYPGYFIRADGVVRRLSSAGVYHQVPDKSGFVVLVNGPKARTFRVDALMEEYFGIPESVPYRDEEDLQEAPPRTDTEEGADDFDDAVEDE